MHALKKLPLAAVAAALVIVGTPAAFAGNANPTMQADPTSGPPGTLTTVSAIVGCLSTNNTYDQTVYVGDQPNLLTGASLGSMHLGDGGTWSVPITIPNDATVGSSVTIYAQCIGTPNAAVSGSVPAAAVATPVVLSTYTPIPFAVTAPPTTTSTSTSTTTSTSTSTTTTTAVVTTTTTTTTPTAIHAVPDFMYPGQSCLITAQGFKPGTGVTITVHSDPLVIGTFAADATGSISQSWTVPSGFAAGAHTVVLSGQTIAGSVELSAPITVGSLVQAITTAAPTTAVITTTGNLPTTGSGLTEPLVAGAAVLVLCGGAAVVVSRRRDRGQG